METLLCQHSFRSLWGGPRRQSLNYPAASNVPSSSRASAIGFTATCAPSLECPPSQRLLGAGQAVKVRHSAPSCQIWDCGVSASGYACLGEKRPQPTRAVHGKGPKAEVRAPGQRQDRRSHWLLLRLSSNTPVTIIPSSCPLLCMLSLNREPLRFHLSRK